MTKYIYRFFLLLLTSIFALAIWQYFFSVHMSMTAGTCFMGTKLYNPYENLNASDWVKCNFHAHTKAWGGLTCGEGTEDELWKAYDGLNYRIHCISEYQQISHAFSCNPNYVPAYEHGYNLMKAHQLVIGSSKVSWIDFMLPQTRSNKQWVIDHLTSSPKDVVVLNHPEVRDAYTPEDMKYLSGFNCIEVLNPSAMSFSIWDAALSAGKPVFITANDDLHQLHNQWDVGRFCTFLSARVTDKQWLINDLKSGKGYGMEIGFIQNEEISERITRIKDSLPYLQKCTIKNDTLLVEFSKAADQIQFIGQEGKLLADSKNCKMAMYCIRKCDAYVRTAVSFQDSIKIYLNPIYRYNGDPLAAKGSHSVDQSKTLLSRMIGIALFGSWLYLLIRILINVKFRHTSPRRILRRSQEEPTNLPALE